MSQDKRDLAHFLSIECPHCALSEFFVLWEEYHPDTSPKKLLGAIFEVGLDFIADAPSHADQCRAVAFSAQTLKKWFQEIIEQRYKIESETIEVGSSANPPKGGLH